MAEDMKSEKHKWQEGGGMASSQNMRDPDKWLIETVTCGTISWYH